MSVYILYILHNNFLITLFATYKAIKYSNVINKITDKIIVGLRTVVLLERGIQG
jgi:hypothetical protein